jgi:hypothetical protein
MLSPDRNERLFIVYPGALLDWWEVQVEGSKDGETFAHEHEAIAYAKRIASTQRPSRVVLEDWYGRCQKEWSFGQAKRAASTL